MELEVGWGKGTQKFAVREQNLIAVLRPNHLAADEWGKEVVLKALREPIGTAGVGSLVHPGEKVVIITSDITRPFPGAEVLPPVLEILEEGGVNDCDITIVFALGSHRPHTEAEKEKLVGSEIYRRYQCVDSDPSDTVRLGFTPAGTPVDISRVVADADRRICLGNIEYHYFAGYSGGAKAVMPGVSTRAAIQANHRYMTEPGAVAGNLMNNPVRDDLEEAIAFCPIDFIVNVVLDEQKRIVSAVAGHFITAHRRGCAFLDRLYQKTIPRRADIVIASQGGAPKDLNLYQTQKALDNARHAVKKGGIIILAGSCKEGLGDQVFEEWMLTAEAPGDLIERIRREFCLGGHKAAAIAQVLKEAEIYLVSELAPPLVERLFMRPFTTVGQALNCAQAQLGSDAEVLVMPYAGSTLPVVREC